MSWIEEDVQKDPLAMPDAFFRLVKLTVNPDKPKEVSFCGPSCVKDYFTYVYTEPQPPRIALENAKREQAKQLENLNPHLVPGSDAAVRETDKSLDPLPVTVNTGGEYPFLGVVASPVPQADGDPGE